jgi:hypothetical protein
MKVSLNTWFPNCGRRLSIERMCNGWQVNLVWVVAFLYPRQCGIDLWDAGYLPARTLGRRFRRWLAFRTGALPSRARPWAYKAQYSWEGGWK